MKKKINIFLMAFLLFPCMLLMTACGSNSNAQKFSIRFIVDEQVYAKVETAGNEYIQMPSNPSKIGYTFDGWFFD